MTALAADRLVSTKQQNTIHGGIIINYGVAAADQIYKGSLVGLEASTGALWARALVAGDAFVGISLDNVLGTTHGAKTCAVLVGCFFQHTLASVTTANIGSLVYASDDATLTLTATGNSLVGRVIEYVTTNTCLVSAIIPGQTD